MAWLILAWSTDDLAGSWPVYRGPVPVQLVQLAGSWCSWPVPVQLAREPRAAVRGPAVAGDRSRPGAPGSGARSAAGVVAGEVKSQVFHKQYGIFFYENPI